LNVLLKVVLSKYSKERYSKEKKETCLSLSTLVG
jgi:hypothetical protein